MPNNNANNGNKETGVINQAKEAHKGIQKIITIWRTFASDPDPSIRVLTLIATVIGFLALVAFLIICIYCMSSGPPSFNVIAVLLFGPVCLFLVVAAPVAWRYSNSVPTKILADGFDKIYKQKYGATIGNKKL